jgi:hypothetical protein
MSQVNDSLDIRPSSEQHKLRILLKPSALAPIQCNENDKLFRVVVIESEEHYKMFVGDGYLRVFTKDTLPADLRLKMLAVDVFIESNGGDQQLGVTRSGVVDSDVYTNLYDPVLDDVGWRYGKYYCVIMTDEELAVHKGEAHDARSKSQS